jgi:inorganic phosphate transporter, PiT family
MELLPLIIVIVLVLTAEYINGWTDAPNAIATVVSTGVLEPKVAIPLAAVLNLLGTMSGTAVALTIAKGIVATEAVTLEAVGAAMLAIILWGGFAAYKGLPISKSHALLAGLAGAGLAGGGIEALLWSGWGKVLLGLFLSPLFGFFGAFVLGKLIIFFFARIRPTPGKRTFNRLQIVSASAMAFMHGMNDGQKFVGVFTLVLILGGLEPLPEAGQNPTVHFWVVVVCALTMGLGTTMGGWRIIATVGKKMVEIESWQGFAAETAGSLTILGASLTGTPVSTTHVITSAIAGSSASLWAGGVRWYVALGIVKAWVWTFPICAGLAFVVALVANRLF